MHSTKTRKIYGIGAIKKHIEPKCITKSEFYIINPTKKEIKEFIHKYRFSDYEVIKKTIREEVEELYWYKLFNKKVTTRKDILQELIKKYKKKLKKA